MLDVLLVQSICVAKCSPQPQLYICPPSSPGMPRLLLGGLPIESSCFHRALISFGSMCDQATGSGTPCAIRFRKAAVVFEFLSWAIYNCILLLSRHRKRVWWEPRYRRFEHLESAVLIQITPTFEAYVCGPAGQLTADIVGKQSF
ncbi:hypothetical protein MPTK1_5g00350 [Marchantia polymorpha subsp. ruderalis]|uniref:Uncharacterized protein n=2 Tax=Marchantia polymorpha TaxID=3197 RepID=A0AAF6BDF1_MARPO|nr:hypothetical protein MARPO_0078s0035 [Marchantia polymorpha]BBN10035.1 hypothetical protein Mp_5g00350 [Marchantia polymorpha subsp. ruderalis]|eukprot:PTQ34628.1 hypothetical protein MARPO_0078s0035 [Marchantia polymorpha]